MGRLFRSEPASSRDEKRAAPLMVATHGGDPSPPPKFLSAPALSPDGKYLLPPLAMTPRTFGCWIAAAAKRSAHRHRSRRQRLEWSPDSTCLVLIPRIPSPRGRKRKDKPAPTEKLPGLVTTACNSRKTLATLTPHPPLCLDVASQNPRK
jgi:hypothetical protein